MAIIKLKPHRDTPAIVLETLAKAKAEAQERMELRKIEVQMLGVELRHSIATKLKEVADGTRKPYLPNGEVDGREGWQYLYENSANSKNEAATMAMLVTGKDPESSNINVAILNRVKSEPIRADDGEDEVVVQDLS